MRADTGFTIVALMMAMAIGAITLAIGIPAYNRTIRPTAELNSAARLVFSDIQLARMRSVNENVRIGLQFDSAGYSVFKDGNADYTYTAAGDGAGAIVKQVQFSAGLGYGNLSFDTNQGGGDGVTFAQNSFSFSTRGLPFPEGSVYLRNNKTPSEGRQVDVNAMGGVRIKEY